MAIFPMRQKLREAEDRLLQTKKKLEELKLLKERAILYSPTILEDVEREAQALHLIQMEDEVLRNTAQELNEEIERVKSELRALETFINLKKFERELK